MPITPFHFGPGAALHAIAPRHVSFLAFCAANVLIDLESLYNLVNHQTPVHTFLHSYIGATLIVAFIWASFSAMRWLSARVPVPILLRWKELSHRQVSLGAFLGAYTHIVFDSIMHSDMRPMAPFESSNALLGLIDLGRLHWFCVLSGVAGVCVILVRLLVRHGPLRG